jgi:hypothetical protein
MFDQDDKTKMTYWGEVIPVFVPALKREEDKIEEVSHLSQRPICRISPFFKETAQTISSILSDYTQLLLEGQYTITSKVG